MKHLINKPHGTNVFHIHLQRRAPEERDVQLGALLGVEATLYAVVHEGHEACCDDDAVHSISWLPTLLAAHRTRQTALCDVYNLCNLLGNVCVRP